MGATVFWLSVATCYADPVLNSGYSFNLVDLGSVSLPLSTPMNTYEGIDFKGQSLLLAAWNPYQPSYPTSEELWQVPLTYTGGQISQLGSGSAYATVSTNADNFWYSYTVAGGLTLSSSGTLYYTTSEGDIGWYQSGASIVSEPVPDPSDSPSCAQNPYCAHYLTAVGYLPVGNSTELVAAFSSGNWYQVTGFTTTAQGIIANLGSLVYSGVEATSFVYFPGPFAGFTNGGILVGDSGGETLSMYGLNANGQLIPNSTPIVVSSTGTGQFAGFGVARDPQTGNFLFTTNDSSGNGQIYELQIQTPEPATPAMLTVVAVLAALLLWWRGRSLTGPAS